MTLRKQWAVCAAAVLLPAALAGCVSDADIMPQGRGRELRADVRPAIWRGSRTAPIPLRRFLAAT